VTLPSGPSEVDLMITFVGAGGASITYRQHVSVETTNTTASIKDNRKPSVRAIWPAKTQVCRLTTDCGRERTWIGPTSETLNGVSINASATGYHANISSVD
jgi:hypothetical protein